MRLAEHFIAFHSKFNKFNKTGAQILVSFYHMSLKLLENCIFVLKSQDLAIFYAAL